MSSLQPESAGQCAEHVAGVDVPVLAGRRLVFDAQRVRRLQRVKRAVANELMDVLGVGVRVEELVARDEAAATKPVPFKSEPQA